MSTQPRVNKLKEAMTGMAGAVMPAVIAPIVPQADAAEVKTVTEPTSQRPPSRRNKKNVSGYVNKEAAKQLRLLAVERDSSTQSLIEEALNDLFRKYGKSAIA